MKLRILLLCMFILAPGAARALELDLPIECEVGKSCYLQYYVDTQAGKGAKDYRCGSLSYEDNIGTDFRLADYGQLQRGVMVKAAAAGKVIGVRDGLEDINIRDINPDSIKGQECGNAVVLDHGNGWNTQYCHLMKSRMVVKEGDEVQAGQHLGRVGLSGDTYFPHFSFLVRHNGTYIDPFTARSQGEQCTAEKPEFSLWTADASLSLPSISTSIVNMGFSKDKPDSDLSRQGAYDSDALSPDSEQLVIWADFLGIQKDDIIFLKITGPAGDTLIEHQKNFIEDKPMQFYFTGKKLLDGTEWTSGIYTGQILLVRGGSIVLRKTKELYVR